jgi:hypothetical protein
VRELLSSLLPWAGMGLIMTRLQETTVLCLFFRWLIIFALSWYPKTSAENRAFIQQTLIIKDLLYGGKSNE